MRINLFLLLTLMHLFGCKKELSFPDAPHIEFISFERLPDKSGKDSAGIVRLSFTDGNGDLGLGPADTLPPYQKGSEYYFNFFVTYFEKQQGKFIKVNFPPPFPGADTLSSNSRIPDLRSSTKGKSVEGEIEMSLFTANPFSENDTVRFEISICDRALNRSNTIVTPEFILIK